MSRPHNALGFFSRRSSCLAVPARASRRGSGERHYRAEFCRLAHDDADGKAFSSGIRRTIYVPVYSSVAMSQGKVRADFSVTLSVHKASESRPLVVKRIAYFDTAGRMVESYLKSPIAIKPFSTVEVFIATTDVRGGTGANFVVDWAATSEIAEPVVEALMIGGVGAGHYAFVSIGRPIKVVGKN